MASYNELNALIDAYINRNGVQAITGQILNGVLKAMVEQLGRGYTIMGAAIPTTDPGTPDGPECYFASETGTYTDFDGLQVVPGELALLCYTPSDGWTKATIYEGFREVGATIDGNVGTPSVGVSYADGVLSFDFHNMKGDPGQNGQDGQDGAAAGFGTIGADITGGVGTPAVTVESSGPATAKNLQFHFTNLKGETGVTSVVATVDNTTGTPACTVSLVGQQLTLAFTGLKGAQGDTGSSVDYPFTIVNNLTTDDATQALSAAQGVVLEGEITQLEAKVSMFYPHPNLDFTDDVLELWLVKTPGVEVKLQSFQNNAYIVCTGSTIYAKTDSIPENNVAYPIKVYAGATTEFPSGTIVGYIMFRDVVSFKGKSSQNKQIVNSERCFNLANSPMIASAIGEIVANKSINARNTINATNVTDPASDEAAFIREFYLFGPGVDKTKTYKFSQVANNHSSYKYRIGIIDASNDQLVSLYDSLSPDNLILIPEYNSSGVNAYAIVRWDVFPDGSNNHPSINFLPRVYDLNYSPTIKAFLDNGEVEKSFAALSDAFFVRSEYDRSDFSQGYLNTTNASIGDTVTLPSGTTPVSASSVAGYLKLQVAKGDFAIVRYRSLSSKACRAFVVVDESGKILSWANPATNSEPAIIYDTLINSMVIEAEKDGVILLQFPQANYDENSELSVTLFTQKEDYIKVCVPDTIFAVVGDTLQLYYRSIFRCVDFSKYAVKVVCNIGAQYPRYYEVTPLAANVGTHTLEFTIKDNNNNTLGTKTVNLVVVPAGTNPASELNVLCLGASATQNGQWASELKRRLVGTGGTPAGSGKTNIQFVGRKNVTFAEQQVKLEATGGYSFNSYTNINTARYRFNVTAENEPTINVNDVYSNNWNNYTVKEINITAGEGGYFSCEGTGVPQSSGTLTKVSGTGSETITYSSTSFSGNPFVYNGEINMQQYADDYCNPQGAAHGRIDVIFTELFGNGTSVYTDDFTTRMSQMQTFINQVRSVFPNCKFCIGLFWNPDIRGGMGVNYGATGAWSDPYGIKYSNMNLCNALQKYITDNNLSDYVFILNWLNEFDEENDMQQTTKKVNVRSTVTEIFGVNGVHPATVGYYQMADTAWRLFVAKFCQS